MRAALIVIVLLLANLALYVGCVVAERYSRTGRLRREHARVMAAEGWESERAVALRLAIDRASREG